MGVRVVNSILTLARGQRVGLVAGSGVGKSSLLAMMTKHTTADIVVVVLVGERGREATEFIEETLGRPVSKTRLWYSPPQRRLQS